MTQEARTPFNVVERDDLDPTCPHCGEEIAEVYAKARGFPLGQGRTYMYFCPHCRKVLGFAQGRVF
jgi:phage terminase large subunit GpA-like protein